jgi:LytS/YehU family sensor histidine kinase
VRALIDEDPQRARSAVTQLANMLRYSLQSGLNQTVSFEDELTVVNDYLALEHVRHEERLRLKLDIAPGTLRRVLPPMLLQTLVENAVKYGISTRASGGA